MGKKKVSFQMGLLFVFSGKLYFVGYPKLAMQRSGLGSLLRGSREPICTYVVEAGN